MRLFIFFICLIFIGSKFPLLENVSKFIVITYVVLQVFNSLHSNKYRLIFDNKYIFVVASLLLLWVSFRIVNFTGFVRTLQFGFLFLSMCVFPFNISSKDDKKYINILVFILLVINVIQYLNLFVIIDNPNSTAIINLLVFYLAYLYNENKFVKFALFILGAIVVLMCDSRSVVLGLLIGLFSIYIYKRKCLNIIVKMFFIILFFIIISSAGYILDILMSKDFDNLVLLTTGKPFNTGRMLIWTNIFGQMKYPYDYILGLGGGYDYSQIITGGRSPHSGYIYVLSSYGIIGLSLFILLIYLLMKKILVNGYFVSAVLMILFVVRESMEVVLLYNNMALALFFWIYIANSQFEKRHIAA
jgi:hypothetical protein